MNQSIENQIILSSERICVAWQDLLQSESESNFNAFKSEIMNEMAFLSTFEKPQKTLLQKLADFNHTFPFMNEPLKKMLEQHTYILSCIKSCIEHPASHKEIIENEFNDIMFFFKLLKWKT